MFKNRELQQRIFTRFAYVLQCSRHKNRTTTMPYVSNKHQVFHIIARSRDMLYIE